MKEIVKYDNIEFYEKKNTYYITGVEICRQLGYKRPVGQASKIWRKYQEHLKENSVIAKLTTTDGKLYDTRCYNEAGTLFFITRCDITKAINITKKMIDAFLYLKINKQEWLNARADNKMYRKGLTDTIQHFVEYAKDQGSTTANFYYMNITKLIQKNLFYVTSLNKLKLNLRDHIGYDQLIKLTATEIIAREKLCKMMTDRKHYKTVYIELKKDLEQLCKMMGQSIPSKIDKKQFLQLTN